MEGGGGVLHCYSTSLIPCYCSISDASQLLTRKREKKKKSNDLGKLDVLGCDSQSKR